MSKVTNINQSKKKEQRNKSKLPHDQLLESIAKAEHNLSFIGDIKNKVTEDGIKKLAAVSQLYHTQCILSVQQIAKDLGVTAFVKTIVYIP